MKMFGNPGKKDGCRWRFDTSSDNLECFIGTKTRIRKQCSPCDKRALLVRKRGKSNKGKAINFQNKAFLESILANTFSKEFAGSDDIKDLVDNINFNEQEEHSSDEKIKQLYKQPRFIEKKSQELVNSLEEYKLFVGTPKAKKCVTSTRVGTEETPEQSRDICEQSTPSSFSPAQNYSYPYYTEYYKYPYPQYRRYQQHQFQQQARDFRIDLEHIEEDGRTTLMIRNIPNKYTQQLLIEQFSKQFKVKFDFFYLPIDFNNTCNVGYAFINFIHTKFIKDFYHEFNGKKWNRFNSQKICSLTYAKIQGTGALKNHFKNSHVMQQKDKRLRPLLTELGDEQRNNLNKIVQEQLQKM